ncbi:MAG TPA: TadE/TadG family type IV pilus assembly protein [Blastocatellia bacterium]|nr:TadE/TadG family type IV pilus assembly protein [Blastocatellia bacterium]
MSEQRTDSSERGAAILEGALILLALFTLIFAIWEAGRMFNVQEVVTNAAREGARLAVTPLTQTLPGTLPSDTDVQTRVNQFLQSSSIEGATITINDGAGIATPVVINGNEFTKVKVSVPYSFLSLPLLGDLSVTITGESLMRNETSP